jgi:amidohydrolase
MNHKVNAPFDVKKAVKEIEKEIIGWRRTLHQMPEIGLSLPQTSAFIASELEAMKIPFKRYLDSNAIVGFIRSQHNDQVKTVGLRADMDALPIAEETGLSFASRNGNMHACGHDAHMAMLLGAAKVLNDRRDLLPNHVALIFQPGEEYPGGAKPMIEEGALRDHGVSVIAGLHSGQIVGGLEPGSIYWTDDKMMASMDRFHIDVKGKGAHGASPHGSEDPVIAACQIVMALQNIRSRNISGLEPAVLSVTRIESGFNQNIIPEKAEIEGTVRALRESTQKKIAARIDLIATNIARGLGCEATVDYEYLYPPLINDKATVDRAVPALTELFGERVKKLEKLTMGGEDFAFYLKEVPGLFLFLSNPGEIDGRLHPHHNAKFDVDESHFKTGAAALVQLALRL